LSHSRDDPGRSIRGLDAGNGVAEGEEGAVAGSGVAFALIDAGIFAVEECLDVGAAFRANHLFEFPSEGGGVGAVVVDDGRDAELEEGARSFAGHGGGLPDHAL
ncbi:MAG: hypothetical protein RL545_769, partial [Actinomycetota bacterium]